MPTAHIVAGLGFGDEGKGATVDALCRQTGASLVVRYNGGCQAAHNVITPDGRHHTFAQFGSGTFAGAKTFLSQHVIINPLNMVREYEHLCEVGESDANYRLITDARCLVVTPFQRTINRLLELSRGEDAHGSCGMGIGQAFEDALSNSGAVLRAGDLLHREVTREKLRYHHDVSWEKLRDDRISIPFSREFVCFHSRRFFEFLLGEYARWADTFFVGAECYLRGELSYPHDVVFEGAQGVLLDQTYGMHPHTTWSNCTFGNAENLLDETGFVGEVKRIGVLRAYHTRHGAGPFPTESSAMTDLLPDTHNTEGRYQGGFRVGAFDARLARYAIAACGGVDELHLTCLDRLAALDGNIPLVDTKDTKFFFEPESFIAGVESAVEQKITDTAWGPTAKDRISR